MATKVSEILANGLTGPTGPTGPAGPAGPVGSTGPVANLDYYEPYLPLVTAGYANTIQSLYFQPINLQGGLQTGVIYKLGIASSNIFKNTNFTFSASATGTVSKYFTFVDQMALYTFDVASNRIGSYWKTDQSWLVTQENRVSATVSTGNLTVTNLISISIPVSYHSTSSGPVYSTFSGSASTSSTGNIVATVANLTSGAWSSVQAYLSGSHLIPFIFNTTASQEAYVLGHRINTSTSTASATDGQNGVSVYGASNSNTYLGNHSYVYVTFSNQTNNFKRIGYSTTNSSTHFIPFLGAWTATSNDFPLNITNTDIRPYASTNNNQFLYFNYHNLSIA